jgi:hypothetical protein
MNSPAIKGTAALPSSRIEPKELDPSSRNKGKAQDLELFGRVATELTRMAQTIKIPLRGSTPPPVKLATSPAVSTTSEACWTRVAASDNLDLGLLAELGRAVLESRAEAEAIHVAARMSEVSQPVDVEWFVCGGSDSGWEGVFGLADSATSQAGSPSDSPAGCGFGLAGIDPELCGGTEWGLAADVEQPPDLTQVTTLASLPDNVFAPPSAPVADPAPRNLSAPSKVVDRTAAPAPRDRVIIRECFGLPYVATPLETAEANPPRVFADLPRDVFARSEIVAERKSANSQQEIAREMSRPATPLAKVTRPRLGHAVELTREALSAWVNILAGPAVVDVTSP